MRDLAILRACSLSVLFVGLLWMQAPQRSPHQHAPSPKPTPAYEQPLTGYEVVVLFAEFIDAFEKGLTEAFQKPIRTGGAGKVTLTGTHPAWAIDALKEVKARGAIPSQFNGSKPMARYQVAVMLARYARQLDARMRTVVGAPIGKTEFRVQPRIALDAEHPAYADLQFLAQGGWVQAGSTLYHKPMEPILGKELPDMLRDLAQRVLERYRDEPHLKESTTP
ncbi:MAG: hypothetical protein C4337_07520 [Armatimonadota bacterium]